MLSQVVTNQAGQQKGARQEEADTSRIREFLRMNPPSFTGSSTTEDPVNFIEELKKWKRSRVEDAPSASWACFEEAFLGRFFPQELKKAKFTQLSRYTPEMVKDMRSRMSLFVAELGRLSSKEGRAAMLIGDMDILRLMGSMAQGGSKPPAFAKCGRDHSECPKNKHGSGNGGNKAQSSSVAPLDRATPRGATFCTGRGANRLYAITSHQE
ncbi:uncharacterized protein LOC125820943 [Solanum verrucosum]|uniref:uncharacterized protein LOC125820943 n=1 Tax=Solanum verrucosum TaxID=315347 RepID=UPI0020D0E923|nr:uncharacterized protein LOC125820943 [Solanum verrucosum]